MKALLLIGALLSAAVYASPDTYYPAHGTTVPATVSAPNTPSAMDFIGAPNGGYK